MPKSGLDPFRLSIGSSVSVLFSQPLVTIGTTPKDNSLLPTEPLQFTQIQTGLFLPSNTSALFGKKGPLRAHHLHPRPRNRKCPKKTLFTNLLEGKLDQLTIKAIPLSFIPRSYSPLLSPGTTDHWQGNVRQGNDRVCRHDIPE